MLIQRCVCRGPVSSQGYGNTTYGPSIIEDWCSTNSNNDTNITIASYKDMPTSSPTCPLTTMNLSEHNRTVHSGIEEGQESQTLPQLKSTLESLGVYLPDTMIIKMLPHSEGTTLMERILAKESLRTGSEGYGEVLNENHTKE